MHNNTSESSRTPRSHKNTDSCPDKECSMTIIQFMSRTVDVLGGSKATSWSRWVFTSGTIQSRILSVYCRNPMVIALFL